MIIDCHGHYTTAPAAHNDWRELQKAAFKAGGAPPPYPAISDDEIRETLENNQLRLLRERGADMTIFSPRASAMAHHVGDEAVSKAWARANNDLIARCVALYPEVFAGVCMLPQNPKADLAGSIAELERCAGSQFDPHVVEVFKQIPQEDWNQLRKHSITETAEVSSFQSIVTEIVTSANRYEMVH